MPNLKLTYFNFSGRAEPARLALTIGNIAFDDERIEPDEFAKRKPDLPFGSVPVLEVDGTIYTQSDAILRYVGKLSGFYPADDLTCLKIDQLLGGIEDIFTRLGPTMRMEGDEKLRAREELRTTSFPRYLGGLERLAQGEGFAVGNQLTVADFSIYTLIRILKSGMLDGIPSTITDSYPKLTGIYTAILQNPKVKAWNDAHAK